MTVSTDHVRRAAAECGEFLRSVIDADWSAAVPDLDMTVAAVVAHAAEGCLWYAIDLAAGGQGPRIGGASCRAGRRERHADRHVGRLRRRRGSRDRNQLVCGAGLSPDGACGPAAVSRLAAWLLVLALPPTLPVTQLLVGVSAAVLLGKHLYGGLGRNPFNPAMVGYAVLIVSFPLTMTAWPTSAAGTSPAALVASPGSGMAVPALDEARGGAFDRTRTSPGGASDAEAMADADAARWDAMTAATPLDRLRTAERSWRAETETETATATATATTDTVPLTRADGTDAVLDAGAVVLDSPWPWVNGGFLAGGLWLLARGVIGWRIPVSMLGTLALLHAVHGAVAAVPQPPVHAELLAGAAMLGAFFIATDPVSAASGPRARLVYGAGIGALTFVLREFGAYPEGVAFAVLLMNATVPLLDRLSVPPRRAS